MDANFESVQSSKSPPSNRKASQNKLVFGRFQSQRKQESSYLKNLKNSLMELDEMLEHEVNSRSSFGGKNST